MIRDAPGPRWFAAIEGPPGVGKSELAARLAAAAGAVSIRFPESFLEFRRQTRIGLGGDDAADELRPADPPGPATERGEDRHRTAIDGDRHRLARAHPVEQGSGVVA